MNMTNNHLYTLLVLLSAMIIVESMSCNPLTKKGLKSALSATSVLYVSPSICSILFTQLVILLLLLSMC